MNKYIISNNGLGIAVGVIGETAKEDATLAENIYGCNISDHLFGSLIYMPSVKQFRKFLILKEYFKVWDKHWAANKEYNDHLPIPPNVYRFTKEAIKQAKEMEKQQGYSEEDIKNAFLDGWELRDGDLPFPKAKNKWFNEFKKK